MPYPLTTKAPPVEDVRDAGAYVPDRTAKPMRYKHKATQTHKLILRSVARSDGDEADATFTFQAPMEMDQDKEYYVALESFVSEANGNMDPGGPVPEFTDRIVSVKTSFMTRNITDIGGGGFGARTLAVFTGSKYTTTGMSPMNAGKITSPWWQAPTVTISLRDIDDKRFEGLEDTVKWVATLVFFSAPEED